MAWAPRPGVPTKTKPKFLLINLPFKTLTVKRLALKKKTVLGVYMEEKRRRRSDLFCGLLGRQEIPLPDAGLGPGVAVSPALLIWAAALGCPAGATREFYYEREFSEIRSHGAGTFTAAIPAARAA